MKQFLATLVLALAVHLSYADLSLMLERGEEFTLCKNTTSCLCSKSNQIQLCSDGDQLSAESLCLTCNGESGWSALRFDGNRQLMFEDNYGKLGSETTGQKTCNHAFKFIKSTTGLYSFAGEKYDLITPRGNKVVLGDTNGNTIPINTPATGNNTIGFTYPGTDDWNDARRGEKFYFRLPNGNKFWKVEEECNGTSETSSVFLRSSEKTAMRLVDGGNGSFMIQPAKSSWYISSAGESNALVEKPLNQTSLKRFSFTITPIPDNSRTLVLIRINTLGIASNGSKVIAQPSQGSGSPQLWELVLARTCANTV